MKTSHWRFAVIFIALLPAVEALSQEAVGASVEKLAQPYVDNEIINGMSIGVVRNGQSQTVHLGQVSDQGGKPNDETIYEIGSVSKVFTGLLLADAVIRKEIRLDQPAQDLLPENVKFPRSENRDITLVELSTHTSGLPRLSDNMPSLTSENPYADFTAKLAYEFLNKHKLRREPGSQHEYSNLGVSFLGHLIALKTGKSYDEMLSERITGPLNMTSTRVELTDALQTRLATGHLSSGEPTNSWTFADMPGAGGIHSCVTDMLAFANASIHPPDNELGKAIDLAWKKHYNGSTSEPAMGLGWHFAGDGSTRWHNGQTGGYHSMLLVNRDLGLAVVVLANTASMEVDVLANDLIRMLAGANVQPRSFADKKSIEVPAEVMKRYVGQYQLIPGLLFTVSMKNDKLMVGLTGQPTFQVFARSETEWFYKVVEASLTFKVDEDGNCTAVELFQNGVRQTAQRIEP